VAATLYSLELSHPGKAAALMLRRKGIEHRVVNLLPGFHPALVRALGFRRNTVPALRIDGRRMQGSLEISRGLDEIRPDPPLFPADPAFRAKVEEAEAWGDGDFQHAPRRAFRWCAGHDRAFRRWIAEEEGLPLPGLVAEANVPIARLLARRVGADDDGVRAMLASLPGMLDRVDALIAEGVIGGDEPNAADFQLLTTVRTLLAMDDLRPFVAGRPCEPPARALWPDPVEPVPGALPADWLQRAPGSARSAATA
jgi:glutathione S-transferase